VAKGDDEFHPKQEISVPDILLSGGTAILHVPEGREKTAASG
jgi:hypothetical protein